MPRRPPVDGAANLLLLYMGRDTELLHGLYKVGDIVTLVGPQGATAIERTRHHHLDSISLRRPGCQGRLHIHDQTSAVFHQGMSQIGQP